MPIVVNDRSTQLELLYIDDLVSEMLDAIEGKEHYCTFDGINTILTDEGTNISKGQKQLLTIARAMLLPARMLILDEATSNVDTRTELKIQNAMHKLMENKTCFVIAHRLSTIRDADWILVVNEGDVVQQGTHESLMEQDGLYRQMYMHQFE